MQSKLELAYPAFRVHAERLWTSSFVRRLYPIYLSTMHMVVRAAVPLMRAAVEEACARGPDDKVAAGLVEYLTRHMREEEGHDIWLLQDLEATGNDPREPLSRIPSPSVAALVGAQYYWLRHSHPVSILGHIAALESYHPPAGFARQLSAQTGYPAAAFRAIARHEVLDTVHARELFEVVDALPLKRAHETLIGVSALHTLGAGIDVLEGIYAHVAVETREPISSAATLAQETRPLVESPDPGDGPRQRNIGLSRLP